MRHTEGEVARSRPGLDAEDFDTEIYSQLDRSSFDLQFRGLHRRVWKLAPGIALEHGCEDERDDTSPRWLRSVELPLGSVTACRRMIDGREDELGSTDLRLYVEPGPESELRVTRDARALEEPRWSDAITETFHDAVRALCDGTYPPARVRLRESPRESTADAIVRDGYGGRGVEVRLAAMDDWWSSAFPIDVARLVSAIERGESHGSRAGGERWAVLRGEHGSVRVLFPLLFETLRVDLAHLRAPLWVGRRFWLAMDLRATGEVDGVTIRSDRDPAWRAEDDDADPSRLEGRLSETAYPAVEWVTEAFAREEA